MLSISGTKRLQKIKIFSKFSVKFLMNQLFYLNNEIWYDKIILTKFMEELNGVHYLLC